METLGGLLVLAAIVGAIMLFRKATNAGWSKLNRSVLSRGDHARGLEQTSTGLAITTARSGSEVVDAVVRALGLADKPTGLLPSVYITGRDDEMVVFRCGSKMLTSFQSCLSMSTSPEGTSSGVYVVQEWSLDTGIVMHLKEMERLRAEVQRAITTIDPTAEIASVSTR